MKMVRGGAQSWVLAVLTGVACAGVVTAAAGSDRGITFTRDVLPILQERCQSCHRPGQVAPFSLLLYSDARKWATEIRDVTKERTMPPWLAAPDHGDFEGVRRLSDREIGVLAGWVDGGLKEGRPEDAPAPRTWTDAWELGEPDLVLESAEPYTVAASGDDEFRVFVMPTGLADDRQVVAIDFKPGNRRVVHHLVSFVDTSGQGRRLDEADPGPGYSSGPGGIKVPAAQLQGVWAPGNHARFLPDGVSRPLPKGADLLVQVHYHKTGKPEVDRTRVGLYFAKAPAPRRAQTLLFGPLNIDIPPGEARHEVRLKHRFGIEMQLLTIMPHMHLLGREFRVSATLPDGTRKPLVWIPRWDYRWQDSFRFREPLTLPRGTELELVAHFDNSRENPRNPSDPPRRVRFGEQTTDEMAFAIMEVVMGGPLGNKQAGR